MKIAAIIFAGGKSRRFDGKDKALIPVSGRAMIDHVIERIEGQVDHLAINRKQPLKGYALPSLADLADDYPGPIGGLEAGIKWAEGLNEETKYLLTVPVDTPNLPRNLVSMLLSAAEKAGAAIVTVGDQLHPTISLHKIGHIKPADAEAFKHKALRDFWNHVGAEHVSFDDESAFVNINSPADKEKYQDKG